MQEMGVSCIYLKAKMQCLKNLNQLQEMIILLQR